MRKILLSLVILLFALTAPIARSQALTPDEKDFFQKQVNKLVKIEPKRLASPALDKVFALPIYQVHLTVGDGMTEMLLARLGDDAINLTSPGTTADLPDYQKIFKSDFTLKADADATALQDALDVLYPIDTTFNKDDLNARAFKHDGATWTFIRGKFFDHFKGFVIKTSDDGKITGVQYSLEIK